MAFPDSHHQPLTKGERVLFRALIIRGAFGLIALAVIAIRFLGA